MKFNIKNSFRKKNLKKLGKATLIGIASLALIIPLAGNGASVQASSHHSLRYYEKCMNNDNFLDYATIGNDDSEYTLKMKILVKHPSLKHMLAAKETLEATEAWDSDDWNFYARHCKQIYSPYLKRVMPKREPDAYSESGVRNVSTPNIRHNNYLIRKARKQLGLFHRSHRHAHRRVRHARRNHRHYSHKHAHRRSHVMRHHRSNKY